MNLDTLAELREELWAVGPIPKTPYVTATTAQKAKADSYLNQACRRLLGKMKPKHTMRRLNVPVYNGSLTMPREMDSIDGIEMVDASNCACSPLQIYSRFHEWARPALNCCCSTAVFVLSDMVQTFKDPEPSTDGYKLRVKSFEGTSKNMIFHGGFNADWDQIFSTEELEIANGTATTTTIWKVLPRVQKPITDAYVELYSVDVATDVETLIAVYAPGETNPAYKRYRVPDWSGWPLARIFGKLGFTKATADNDLPFPNNSGALKLALQALSYEDAADRTRSADLWANAMSILDEERADSEDAEQPLFNVDPQFGIGSIPQIM